MDFNENISYKSIIEKYIAAYNNFDIPEMLSCFHDEVHFQNITGGVITMSLQGKAELKEQAEAAIKLFSHRCQEITDIKFERDLAVVLVNFSGTFAIDIPGGPAAGQLIEVQGKSEFRFKDGKIIELKDIS